MKWIVKEKQFIGDCQDGQQVIHDITIKQHEFGPYLSSHSTMGLSIADSWFKEGSIFTEVAAKMAQKASDNMAEQDRLLAVADKKMFASAGVNGHLEHALNLIERSDQLHEPYLQNFKDFRKVLHLLATGKFKIARCE